jgi:GntR family transcriptional regulator
MSISVVFGSTTPVYKQIVHQVIAAVAAGTLVEDEALPTIRDVAEELTLNPTTFAKAYAELAREGIIDSQGSRGSFVKARRKQYTRSERRRRIDLSLRAYISEALLMGFTTEEMVAELEAMAEELSPVRSGKPRGGSR